MAAIHGDVGKLPDESGALIVLPTRRIGAHGLEGAGEPTAIALAPRPSRFAARLPRRGASQTDLNRGRLAKQRLSLRLRTSARDALPAGCRPFYQQPPERP